ncbi:SAV_2336 N-terminal domain-related protein [Kitasatospora sp. NPDC086791]|uniref:SAV_2336 N-terminal domain-related protein n=1 Tax=Kitasatospora sp. NPDC086791 TaxID=3155178 RepID=UPI00343F6A70
MSAAPVPPELLRELSRLLTPHEAGPGSSTDPRDLADVLWLTRVCGLRRDGPVGRPGWELPPLPAVDAVEDERATAAWNAALRAAVAQAAQQDAPEPAPESAPVAGPEPLSPAQQAGTVPEEPEPVVPFHLPSVPGRQVPGGAPAAIVRAPARPTLTGTLALSRALRPLRRTVRSAHELVLDEEATVSVSGQAGLLLPVWRSAPERWLDVDVVIDAGPTMAVWSTLGDELVAMLRRHGAFHQVRAWSVHDRAGKPVLTPRGPGTYGTGPGPTADPRGRRVVLLLTDGVGPLWHSGALRAVMHVWSRHAPVTVLQVLPRRHWHRTALHPVPARARMRPGDRPTVIHAPEEEGWGRPGTAWAGVLELRADWLMPWARMLSGRTSDWTPVLAVPLDGAVGPAAGPAPAGEAQPAEETPAELLARFRRDASPTAYELAGFLAAAPLSLPVMRHVQTAMLGDSSTTHLAEIYLSGLMERRSPERAGEDPEAVLYDFRPGVRERLLGTLTRGESVAVLRVLAGVSRSVAGAFGGTLDFRALAALAEGGSGPGPVLPPESVPFAEVAVEVLRGLGGADRALAERLAVSLPTGSRLRRAAAESAVPAHPSTAIGPSRPERRWWQRRPPAAEVTAASPVGSGTRPSSPTWHNLPPDLPDVTGWEHRVLRIEQILDPAGTAVAAARPGLPSERRSLCVVQGPNGTGKTAVALAYAHLHLADYSLVWWVDGGSPETIGQSLDQLAILQGVPLEGDAPAMLNRWLAEHPGWLIVIDDLGRDFAESERWMAGYAPRAMLGERWPPEGYGSVLITTRATTNDRTVLEGHLLQFRTSQRDARPAGAANAPDDDLAALPGLLARAADTSVPQDTRPDPAPAHAGGEPEVRYGPVLDELAREDREALDVLTLCAVLGPVELPIDLVIKGLRAAARPTRTGVGSGDRGLPPGLVGRLSGRHLLSAAPNPHGSVSLRVPAPLQQAIRMRLTPAERTDWGTAAIRGVLAAFPPDPTRRQQWALCTALLPHAHAVLQLPELDSGSAAERADLLHQLARFRAAQGEFDAAEAYLRVRGSVSGGGDDTSANAEANLLMAQVLFAAGRHGAALGSIRRALAALPATGPESDRRSVRARLLAAAVHRELYQLHESRLDLEAIARTMALARSGAPAGGARLDEARVRRELGLTELEAGRLSEAEEHLELAWRELLRLGSDRPYDGDLLEVGIRQDRARLSLLQERPSLAACEVLAASIRKAGRRRDVEALDVVMSASETLVDVMRAYLGTLDTSGENSWRTYQQLIERQLSAMTAIAEAVLAYRRDRAAVQPHRLATALDMYGMLLNARQHSGDLAVAALDEAAHLHRRVHGDQHPALAENRWRLAQVMAAAGAGTDANRLMNEAREVFRRFLGPDHPRLVPMDRMAADD